MLGGVVGRKAGSAAGYHYSRRSRAPVSVWSMDKLDQLAGRPAEFIPGAQMPVRVLDAPSRRDLVAYLQMESRERRDHGSGS